MNASIDAGTSWMHIPAAGSARLSLHSLTPTVERPASEPIDQYEVLQSTDRALLYADRARLGP